MFCTGSATIADLKRADMLIDGRECREFAGPGVVGGYRFSGGRDYVD